MKTETATVGTSPEVLQHYLTAGITIRHTRFNIAKPIELGSLHPEGLLFESMWKWEYADCLPVLRPFTQLCQPLEDGTVPAIELAKLCLGEEFDFENEVAFYDAPEADKDEDGDSHETEETVEVTATDFHTEARIRFTIYPDWTWYGYGESDNCAPAAAIDYLRRHHFAVGLEPHQYIAKPAPAPTPIQEGASHE